jgi:steroid Delta-isomerase
MGGSMHSDVKLTGLLAEHCRRMNTGDVDAMLEIYSPDVRFEDPVGARPMVGHDELRGHFTRAAESQTYDIPGTPVAAGDGRHAMLPVSVQMNYLPLGPALVAHGFLDAPRNPRRTLLTLNVVGLIRADDEGLIEACWIYWGRTDVGLLSTEAGMALRAARAHA